MKITSKSKNGRKSRREFVRQIYAGNRLLLAAALTLQLVEAVLDVGMAYFMQRLIDAATGDSTGELIRVVVMLVTTLAVVGAAGYGRYRLRNLYVERAMRQYKTYAFDRIARKSIFSFAEESSGRYISALTNDAQSVQENYVSGIFGIAQNISLFVFGLALMLSYSWLLTLVGIIITLPSILLALATGSRMAAREQELSARNESFVSTVKDMLGGFSVIKSFKAEREAARIFYEENEGVERARRRRGDMQDLVQLIPGLAGNAAQFGVFAFGAYLAIRGQITAGVMVAFVQMMNYIIWPVQQLPRQFSVRRAALGLVDKLSDVLAENSGKSGSVKLTGIGDGIAISDLTFSYKGADTPALRNVSLNFEPGKSYAIVGGSGSGKTTLLNLMLGSWDDYSGSIRLGGAELRDVDTESLYDLISVIQQNVFIFDNTLENNICMFREFPEAEMQRAIDQAGLSGLIQTKGREYSCGENGSALSGGEKQRISIARCLLRNTPVLMMDEATSALDTQTAWEVTDAILNTEGLTRIVVTHRLDDSLLRRYDVIIALRGGCVVEKGGFDELMAQKGYFYSLYNVAEG